MNERKKARAEQADRETADRRQKAIVSLAHYLGRADVYRHHHDALIHEMLAAGDRAAFTNAKKLRFTAYACAWFAGLSGVIERYQQLVSKGVLPPSAELSHLITPAFLDLLKPFRNAVSHCSDHDDERVLELLATPTTTPDHAAEICAAFKSYLTLHSTRPIYASESG
jgi:hypothetical protein